MFRKHKMKRKLKLRLMGLCVALLPLCTMAQLPPLQAENDIRFIEGGVGLSESDAIKAESDRWSVKISFSRMNGQKSEWVSNALLTIKNSKGTQVFLHKVDGPLILINLKPGRYLVLSTYEGQSKTADINVISGESLSVNIQWR